jgi:hypothetical protein
MGVLLDRNDTKAIKDAIEEVAKEFGIPKKEVMQHVKFDYFFRACVAERVDLDSIDMWGEDLYDISVAHGLFRLTARPVTVWANMLKHGHISEETYKRGMEFYNRHKYTDNVYSMPKVSNKKYKCTERDGESLKLTFPYKRIPWDPVRKKYLRKKDLDKLKQKEHGNVGEKHTKEE